MAAIPCVIMPSIDPRISSGSRSQIQTTMDDLLRDQAVAKRHDARSRLELRVDDKARYQPEMQCAYVPERIPRRFRTGFHRWEAIHQGVTTRSVQNCTLSW